MSQVFLECSGLTGIAWRLIRTQAERRRPRRSLSWVAPAPADRDLILQDSHVLLGRGCARLALDTRQKLGKVARAGAAIELGQDDFFEREPDRAGRTGQREHQGLG